MSHFEALILGLIQGLTEFLPVSSSGHLTIAKSLFGIQTDDISFEVMAHAATVLATIVVFRKEIWQLLCGLFKFRYNEQTKYICMICVSMIPVFIIGVFFKDEVKSLFGQGLLTVGICLFLTALLLFLSEFKKNSQNVEAQEKPITFKSAFCMGLAQAVAALPGLSRSGSTIATGLLCGAGKGQVAKFSFLMVLVPILGEAFLEVVGGEMANSTVGAMPLAIGFLSAFVSGLFACKVMIAIVKKAKLRWFAYYCCAASAFCIIYSFVA